MLRTKCPLLSVAYICHNMDDFLKESLLSVWDFADEIIVVDNVSEDKTLEILYSFPQNKLKIISRKFEGRTYQDVVKQKRNLCLDLAQGVWTLFVDPDEVYMQKDLQWLCQAIQKTDKVHFRYHSIQFWKDFYHVITGPHWDDTQERLIKNLPGLRYDKFAFSVSVDGEVLSKKYGKDFLDGIYWCKEEEIQIYHYGMCITEEKIRRKLRNYFLSDNPVVNEGNVESFLDRHPYFSGDFNQPRHGPKGLWIAGSDDEKTGEKIIRFEGHHPETMLETVERAKYLKTPDCWE